MIYLLSKNALRHVAKLKSLVEAHYHKFKNFYAVLISYEANN